MKILGKLEEILSASFILITVILVIMNVIMRYLLNMGIFWTEEVATYCFVWSVFLGASAAYKQRIHIGIDLLTRIVPEKLKPLSKMIINFFMIIINGYITYLAVTFVSYSIGKPTPVLGISSAYVNSAVLVAFALMTFHALRYFIKNFKIMIKENNN